ncbi:hypothetical protein [Paenibacillus luteus]|uniref:hypothetical protein n=1 Tax=Paenibacillus luteus TaxID=2545753 RepID=UPI001142301E|nr:hypothetical protein [Paenibacillus luteus]
MLLPIIVLFLCLIGGGAVLFYLRTGSRIKHVSPPAHELTAQHFINVKDVRGHYLYTLDGWVLCFLKITPISIDLLSSNEKKQLINMLTTELSTVQSPFKFLAVSRPVDISPLISQLTGLLQTDDPKQKELLKQEIAEMHTLAVSGEVVERQFYMTVWQRLEPDGERDALQQIKKLAQHLDDCHVHSHVLKQQEIVRLCNLIHNPGYTHLEDSEYSASIPFWNEV